MLRRRLDEVAEWELSPSGRLVALHGLSRTHRVTSVTRFLLPDLSSDFARPGDIVRPVSASFLPEQILGIANLSRRTMLAPSALNFTLVALPVCGLPAIVGLLLGPAPAPVLLVGIGIAIAGFFYSLLTSQLHQYAETGSPASLTLWRGIREQVATRPVPPPPPPPEVDWAGRLAVAYARAQSDVVIDIADLAIADGTLILSDPYAIHSERVVRMEVPSGSYQASLAIALIEDAEGNIVDQRTSHAWLRLSPGAPTHWEELAPTTWPKGHVAVDSGAACFTSAAAAKAIVEAYYDDGSAYGYAELLGDAISEGMEKRRRGMWAWTEIGSPAGGLVAFTSGLGDGVYPVFRGLDKDGKLLAVAIDFMVAA